MDKDTEIESQLQPVPNLQLARYLSAIWTEDLPVAGPSVDLTQWDAGHIGTDCP